ncbi:MAG: hypothetical protein K2Y51_04630 [Gammaproteobacteria bacterium]|nr:hypothetical protein [Gammaproteobacteria bacterium]
MEQEIASFDYTVTSVTVRNAPDGAKHFEINFEGVIQGAWEATTLATMQLRTRDLQNGSFTTVGVAYLRDGKVLDAEVSGTMQTLPGHKWRTRGQTLTPDGRAILVIGEMELATRSYKGRYYLQP